MSDAIQKALGVIADWAHGHDGHGHLVSPATVAEARKAMTEWESKRAAAKASPNLSHLVRRALELAKRALVADHLLREPSITDARHDEGMDEPRILNLAGRRFLVTELAMSDTAERISAAKKGQALPGKNGGAPRFPIRNADELDKAIRAVGRARPNTEEERAKVRRFIIERAKALGLSSRIPDNWNADGSLKS